MSPGAQAAVRLALLKSIAGLVEDELAISPPPPEQMFDEVQFAEDRLVSGCEGLSRCCLGHSCRRHDLLQGRGAEQYDLKFRIIATREAPGLLRGRRAPRRRRGSASPVVW